MTDLAAIRAAIGLFHLPSNVRHVRAEPLPSGIDHLLRIAAGDCDAETEVAAALDRPPHVVREAAEFYIEQVLFSPESDHYRILGATPASTNQELRRNMALLMSWLHPDKHPTGDRSVFAARVTGAWDSLRSAEKRAEYDAGRAAAQASARVRKAKRPTRAEGRGSLGRANSTHPGLAHGHDQRTWAMVEQEGLLQRTLAFLRRVLGQRSIP
jgi:hypothetical protein